MKQKAQIKLKTDGRILDVEYILRGGKNSSLRDGEIFYTRDGSGVFGFYKHQFSIFRFPEFNSGDVVTVGGRKFQILQNSTDEEYIIGIFLDLIDMSRSREVEISVNDIDISIDTSIITKEVNEESKPNYLFIKRHMANLKTKKSRLMEELESEFLTPENKAKIFSIGRALSKKRKALQAEIDELFLTTKEKMDELELTNTKFDELNEAYEFSNTDTLSRIIEEENTDTKTIGSNFESL